MKKILAIFLCLGIFSTTPCLAHVHNGYGRPAPHRMSPPPRIERHYYQPAPKHYRSHHNSKIATAAAVTVVGAVGLAAIVSAIAD